MLQDELKEIDGTEASDLDAIEKKIDTVGLSNEATQKAKSEFDKLKMMSPMSSEATVVRHYLDWLLDLLSGINAQKLIRILIKLKKF